MIRLHGFVVAVIVLTAASAPPAAAVPRPPRDAAADAPPLVVAAQTAPPPRARAVAYNDRPVLQKLHDANQMEIQMGRLAVQKGTTKAVKELGRALIEDHTQADHSLDEYLRKHGAELKTLATVTSADPEHEMLATKTGVAFNRAFGLRMVADHTKAIEIVESAQLDTDDDALRSLYDQLLTTLRAHKRAAQEIVAASAGS